MNSIINCRKFFLINWISWKCLGIVGYETDYELNKKQKLIHSAKLVWRYFLNLTVTCIYPLHLILAVFDSNATKSVIFESIAVFSTSLGGSLKIIMFALNMKSIVKMERILKMLDERIHHPEDELLFKQHIKRPITHMEHMYLFIYASVGFFISLASIARGEQKLIYSAWLPFNWHQSWWHYSAALCYQLYGLFFQIMQNFTCDNFSPKALCVLSGHIRLLYKRVARIGYDESLTLEEHEDELNRCVSHQKDLYELFDIIQAIISWPMFCQLFVSLVNLCVAMVALIFFVTDIFYRMYYVVYLTGMMLQLLPVCYYGTSFVILFEQLHYAVFSSNWTGQTKRFKRHMMLFTERSLKPTMAKAGGVFPIHLTTFFATCKGAYSMFAVIITLK